MKLQILFMIGLFFLGCYSPGKTNVFIGGMKVISSFPDSMVMNGKRIDINSFGANTIDIIDTFLVFAGGRLDTFYNVNSKYSYEHCGNFLPKGRGENEFPSVTFPLYCWKDATGVFICLQDCAHGRICNLNISESVAKHATSFSDIQVDVRNIPGFRFIYPINDSVYFFHYWEENLVNECYAYFHKKENNYVTIDTIYREKLSSPGNIFLLNSYSSFQASKKIYVTAMQFLDQINIYALDDKKITKAISVSSSPLKLKDVQEIPMPDKMEFYQDLATTDSLLFAIYSGCTRKEWALNESLPVKIQVFDWEGNPLHLLNMKQKLMKITIDKEEKKLYGLTSSEEVYQYDLSGIL